MMRSRRSRWLSGIGTVVLIGGLVLANYGSGVTPAEATNPRPNPFNQILNKLDEILAAITGGGGNGNHTLRWDTNNASASRFTTAFHGAVLDKNTGLVWEQAPDATVFATRSVAAVSCVNKNVEGTRGWRLPSVAELVSLIDPLLPPPFVPASVFTGVHLNLYWSATSGVENPTGVWVVNLQFGTADVVNGAAPVRAWCVRGGMNADAY